MHPPRLAERVTATFSVLTFLLLLLIGANIRTPLSTLGVDPQNSQQRIYDNTSELREYSNCISCG